MADEVRLGTSLPALPGRSPMAGPARRVRRLGPSLTTSLILHVSILLLLIVTIAQRPHQLEEAPPSDFAMVFEGHSPDHNSGPNPDQTKPSQPGSPAPAVTRPPVPPVPVTPLQMPSPPPPPPPPPPQASAEAQPAPAPPAPAAPQAQPTPPVPSTEPTPFAMAIPHPAPVPAVPSPQPAPRAAPARPTHQNERAPAFPTPFGFSFGVPNATATRPTEQRLASLPPRMPARPGAPGTIDLSFGTIAGGSLSPSASVQMEGVKVSTDWLNQVSAWWKRHGYYPPQAGENGEEGDVTLHMMVDHDGRVEGLELISRSGSQWLDMSALSTFRDAHLPPLPPDMQESQIPFHVTVHYVIIR